MRLFLCEKPSQAKDIAKVMGITQRGKGFLFGKDITITWAIGHLLELANPESYSDEFAQWSLDSLPMIPSQWKLLVKKDTSDQFSVVSRLLKQADDVVIASDADREGEVLARELLDYCHFTGNVKRLWLSALDDASIRKGLDNLLPGEKTVRLYYAGMGRSKADWLIGMNLTRLYTLKARDKGFGRRDVLSIGRVQTPTMALVVRRDLEIDSFVPKPYWKVWAELEKDGIRFNAIWIPAAGYCDSEHRCIQQNAALAVEQLCRNTETAVVLDVTMKRDRTPAPLCFSLSALQQVCSRKWGMGANQVLGIAQALYETHKATTYPRTDCGYLPESMKTEIDEVLSALVQSDPVIASAVQRADRSFISRVWNDKKITAHHAIIPTRQSFDMAKLSQDELKVYSLIRQHYLAQFFPLQEADVTEATFNVGGQLFRTRGRISVVLGWKALFVDEKEDHVVTKELDDNGGGELPKLSQNDLCQVKGGEVKSLQTKPPSHFTDGTLIAAMENAASFVTDPELKKVLRDNAGLGTEATRGGIIETLFKRNYLERKGAHIHATLIARELVSALPETLTSPGMTALWEQSLEDIYQGKLSLEVFMQRQTEWTRILVEKGKQQAISLTPPVTPPCPTCGGITQRIKGTNGIFWGCIKYPLCKGVVSEGTKMKSKSGKRAVKIKNKPVT